MKENEIRLIKFNLILLVSVAVYYLSRGLYYYLTVDRPDLWPF